MQKPDASCELWGAIWLVLTVLVFGGFGWLLGVRLVPMASVGIFARGGTGANSWAVGLFVVSGRGDHKLRRF
jgi:hypothetical protein